MIHMKELLEEEACPCGRGLSYGECCKPNGIHWSRDGDTLHKQYKAAMPSILVDAFEKDKARFVSLFGREPNKENDLVFFDIPAHDNEFFRKGMTFLRNMGLPKEWIYAYYRTDGLMPTVENRKYLSQQDLDLFQEYCREYTELMNSSFDDGSINALLLTSIANKMFEEACDTTLLDLISGLDYFLNYISDRKGFIVSPPNSLKEYASFIAIRAIRAIKSIHMLGISYEAEAIYAIGRSLFECYVYLKNINERDGFFDEEIRPILTSHEYGFEENNGQINYKKMHISRAVNNQDRAKTKVRSLYQLNKCCGPAIDKSIYDYYYRPACQFVHIDAFTARCCFYEEDLYTEFDPSLVAIICTLANAILILEQLAKLPIVPRQQARDLLYLASRHAYKICDCLMMLVVDSEQKEDEYDLLLKRLKMVKNNNWAYDEKRD